MKENVILVDTSDNEIGTMGKQEAHQLGVLHRAFSVFVFNSRGKLLLQQRALDKYHSGGKWTNTCCSHPRPGEATDVAAHRRLSEEMGMACDLQYLFKFIYKAELEDGLTEHECDHVFYGISDNIPEPLAAEAAGFRYIDMDDLEAALQSNPDEYTEWLKICFERVKENYHQIF
ncbi:MAG: isopentenyl-diphosphate Delta-isomerase [Mucilaginibacter sp.]